MTEEEFNTLFMKKMILIKSEMIITITLLITLILMKYLENMQKKILIIDMFYKIMFLRSAQIISRQVEHYS
jgi:hypothetical protein